MLGNVIVVSAFFVALFSVFKYYQAFKGNKRALVQARYGYHIMSVLVICASMFFLYIILTHRYEYRYVFDYSNAKLSTGLLMSTFYAGQEGSFMLWLLLAVVIGIILQYYTSKHEDMEPAFMMIYSFVIVFLIAMVTPFFKSPFELIWSDPNFINISYFNRSLVKMPVFQSFIFNDPSSSQMYVRVSPDLLSVLNAQGINFGDFLVGGKGLNPLLQNFWMEVHPPILFLGYALSVVPFTFAVSALIKNKYDQWVRLALPWTIAAASVLGLGLMIGGYWAYGVLGWGGFWGWDPVENASLIPWLICVALIHTLLIQKQTTFPKKAGRFAKTNLTLAVLTFITVLYSTFLTRSGILSKASVHSFENPGSAVYIYLIVFILTFTAIGLGGILLRRKFLSAPGKENEKFLSRETGLLYGSLFLVASALVVFVGTSAPIMGESVETSFYNKMNMPLALIMCLLIGLSLFLRWRETGGKDWIKDLLPAFIISLIVSAAVILLLNIANAEYDIFLFSAAFALVVNIQMLIRVFRNGFYFWGGHLAHIGFAMFLFGVLASATLGTSEQVELTRGIKTRVLNVDLTFTGPQQIDNGNKYSFDINVDENNKVRTAAPVMFYSDYNNDLMREPYIMEGFTKDLYFSPISYVDKTQNTGGKASPTSLKKDNSELKTPGEILTVEVSTKPFISFVWLGIMIMSIGFILAVLRRNKVNKIESGRG